MRARMLNAGIGWLVALALAATPAAAAPVVDGEFALPTLPIAQTVGSNNEIVQGPDGNMWVTTEQSAVVRIKPDGTVEGPFSTVNSVQGITVGPDNNLWVTTALGVRRIPPNDPANGTSFDIGLANGSSITTGPDGRLWVAGAGELVSFLPSDPEGTNDENPVADFTNTKGMDTGSDGLLWIADGGGKLISATATADPVTTSYTIGNGAQDVAAGLNGQVAYAAAADNEIGLVTPPATDAQRIPIETSDPFGVEFGQDGAYWIARSSKDDLLRLAPDGTFTELDGFSISGNVGPRKVAAGPNNTLWVTLDQQEKVARVTGVEPSGGDGELETTIDKGPKNKVETDGKARVKFKFSSPNAGATFECKLTKKKPQGGGGNRPLRAKKFKACESPKKYKLKPAKYTFRVRAVLGDLVDATPAKDKFKVVEAG